MKYKAFLDNGELVCFYRRNLYRDLLNTKRFKPKGFKDFAELFGIERDRTSYQTSMRLAEKILKEFFKEMATELIENHAAFIMPRIDSFILLVIETTDVDRDDYIYNLDTGGKYFKPVLKWAKPKYRAPYKVRFTRTNRKRLFEKSKVTPNATKS